MNEAVALSRLASSLLRDLEDIATSVEEDDAVHAQSIEVILDAFSSVERIISERKPDETTANPEHFDDPDDAVN